MNFPVLIASRLRRRLLPVVSLVAIAALSLTSSAVSAQSNDRSPFALKNGDRVVFYGDSITDARMYTLLAEEYIVTRFPRMNVSFVHSGWGGDRVGGGGGGPIDLRLDRDVSAYKPTVVTIMLGMNDGSYRAYDEPIFQTFSTGYRHIADKLKKDNPGVRLTFIQPSPYDDVTRPATFDGGYNAVLVRYGAFLGDLAKSTGAGIADLNTPVVTMLTKANAVNPTEAQKIVPDRVHPGWGGHLIMAQSLLKSWNAPSLVSAVTLDARTTKVEAQNADVKQVQVATNGTITWDALEGALPFPILPPDARNAASYNIALASSDFVDTLDREMLTIKNLSAANYVLTIDGQEIGNFTREQLAAGINLAPLATPMLRQAQLVHTLTQIRANTHNSRWRSIQVPNAEDKSVQSLLPAAIKDLDTAAQKITQAQRAAAQPRPHRFALVPRP
ncbi:MAG: SGNH/GDSL hydrolase family protein [Fibrella sp.]|nr:SGNH/GDSL hydrolase family protein [Armatimonadota bacterium]